MFMVVDEALNADGDGQNSTASINEVLIRTSLLELILWRRL